MRGFHEIAAVALSNLPAVYAVGMTESRYAKNAGAVLSLKYHLVWCPEHRRSVLVRPVDTRLKALLREVAGEHNMVIHTLEVMPNHVHLFVEADPTLLVAEIAAHFNGSTSQDLRQEFPHLRSRLPTLWSRSYFAATVGTVPVTSRARRGDG
jgi:putative transposase